MKILALDVGKSKSVAYRLDSETGEVGFKTILTRAESFVRLVARWRPDRVVFEIGPLAGWIHDVMTGCGVHEVQVANPMGEAWRWRNLKRKTDRDDAVKLAELSAAGQLPTVHLPRPEVRQWRQLIAYRVTLADRQTAAKNRVRAILAMAGETLPAGKKGWTIEAREHLRALARPLAECGPEDLWRGMLAVELDLLETLETQETVVMAALGRRAAADERVRRLETIPGLGPRTAEMLVALLDDPHRFGSAKQVSAYLGLVPRQFQSGAMDRRGRITKRGSPLARRLLVQAAWASLRWNAAMRRVFERVSRNHRGRRKVAIVAVARRLAVIAWVMLRDGTTWQIGRAATGRRARPRPAGMLRAPGLSHPGSGSFDPEVSNTA
jgi:transposase